MYDIDTGKEVLEFKDAQSSYDQTVQTQINRIICHPTLHLAITGHEDKFIRFFDTRTGECTHSMVAHLDAVSSLDVSPNGLVLVSGGKFNARFFNI